MCVFSRLAFTAATATGELETNGVMCWGAESSACWGTLIQEPFLLCGSSALAGSGFAVGKKKMSR